MRGLLMVLFVSLVTTACAKAQSAPTSLTQEDLRCLAATAYELDGEGEMAVKMSVFTYYLGQADAKAAPKAVEKALRAELKTLTAEQLHAALARCADEYQGRQAHLILVAGEVQAWLNRKVKEQERQQKHRQHKKPES